MVLSVRDTGQGISSQVLPHIFDRFYRGSPAREGTGSETGLGLAIARSIVEAHGGSIEARSEGEGKGSEFLIRLPVSS
jgi:signal transduction histidine kinase